MDHRYGRRCAAHVIVILHQNGHHLGEYKTRDISASGLFIEADNLELHLGALVDLTFELKNQCRDQYQIKGMLIRHSFEGAGFMLDNNFSGIIPYLKLSDQHTLEMDSYDRNTAAEKHNIQNKYDGPLVNGNFFNQTDSKVLK